MIAVNLFLSLLKVNENSFFSIPHCVTYHRNNAKQKRWRRDYESSLQMITKQISYYVSARYTKHHLKYYPFVYLDEFQLSRLSRQNEHIVLPLLIIIIISSLLSHFSFYFSSCFLAIFDRSSSDHNDLFILLIASLLFDFSLIFFSFCFLFVKFDYLYTETELNWSEPCWVS